MTTEWDRYNAWLEDPARDWVKNPEEFNFTEATLANAYIATFPGRTGSFLTELIAYRRQHADGEQPRSDDRAAATTEEQEPGTAETPGHDAPVREPDQRGARGQKEETIYQAFDTFSTALRRHFGELPKEENEEQEQADHRDAE